MRSGRRPGSKLGMSRALAAMKAERKLLGRPPNLS